MGCDCMKGMLSCWRTTESPVLPGRVLQLVLRSSKIVGSLRVRQDDPELTTEAAFAEPAQKTKKTENPWGYLVLIILFAFQAGMNASWAITDFRAPVNDYRGIGYGILALAQIVAAIVFGLMLRKKVKEQNEKQSASSK